MSLKQSSRPRLEMCLVRQTTNERLGGPGGDRVAPQRFKLVPGPEIRRVLNTQGSQGRASREHSLLAFSWNQNTECLGSNSGSAE